MNFYINCIFKTSDDIVDSIPITPMQGKLPSWQPQVSLEEGLGRMIQQVRDV